MQRQDGTDTGARSTIRHCRVHFRAQRQARARIQCTVHVAELTGCACAARRQGLVAQQQAAMAKLRSGDQNTTIARSVCPHARSVLFRFQFRFSLDLRLDFRWPLQL